MKILHILNDGPCDDAQFIIDQQSNDHDIKIVGGCCGSNPEHIQAIAKIL